MYRVIVYISIYIRCFHVHYRPKSGGRVVRNVQRFRYEDGYICCQADQALVLAVVSNSEGQQLEVSLAKKKSDELSQMWIFKPNGLVPFLLIWYPLICCYVSYCYFAVLFLL